jgi:hypothetical protein
MGKAVCEGPLLLDDCGGIGREWRADGTVRGQEMRMDDGSAGRRWIQAGLGSIAHDCVRSFELQGKGPRG